MSHYLIDIVAGRSFRTTTPQWHSAPQLTAILPTTLYTLVITEDQVRICPITTML